MSEVKKKATTYIGWHWLPADGMTVSYNEVPRHKVRPGRTMRVIGKIMACVNGLHASKRPIDALRYIKGTLIQRVILSGTIDLRTDKAAASHRTCVWLADATDVLRRFVLEWAEQVVKDKGFANEHTKAAFIAAKKLFGKCPLERLKAAEAFWERMDYGLSLTGVRYDVGSCLRFGIVNLGGLVANDRPDVEKLKEACWILFGDTSPASEGLLNKRLRHMLWELRPPKKKAAPNVRKRGKRVRA